MSHTYKLTPVSQYDIAAVERWLEDMAEAGLFLLKFRPLFCTFTRGEPRKTRYRVEPHRRILDDDLPQSMLELYQDFGWNCVDEVNRAMLIFSTQDMSSPELHTDPALQAGQWKLQQTNMRRSFWISIVLLVVLWALILVPLYRSDTPVLTLVSDFHWPTLLLSLHLLYLLIQDFVDLLRVKQLVKQLDSGTPMCRPDRYPRRIIRNVFPFVIACLVLLSVVYPRISGALDAQFQPLEQLTQFPVLSLAQLEGDSFQPYAIELSGVDYANGFSRSRSLLAPATYQVVQTGRPQGNAPSPSLNITRYDLLLRPLAQPLAKELIMRPAPRYARYQQREGEDASSASPVTQVQREAFDYLAYTHQDRDMTTLVAVLDSRVLCVQYVGQGDLMSYLDQIAAMLDS